MNSLEHNFSAVTNYQTKNTAIYLSALIIASIDLRWSKTVQNFMSTLSLDYFRNCQKYIYIISF